MESFFRKSKTHRCEDEALIRRFFALIAEKRERHVIETSFKVMPHPFRCLSNLGPQTFAEGGVSWVKSNLDTCKPGYSAGKLPAGCVWSAVRNVLRAARGGRALVSRTLLNPFFVAGLKGWNYGPLEGTKEPRSIFRRALWNRPWIVK